MRLLLLKLLSIGITVGVIAKTLVELFPDIGIATGFFILLFAVPPVTFAASWLWIKVFITED